MPKSITRWGSLACPETHYEQSKSYILARTKAHIDDIISMAFRPNDLFYQLVKRLSKKNRFKICKDIPKKYSFVVRLGGEDA